MKIHRVRGRYAAGLGLGSWLRMHGAEVIRRKAGPRGRVQPGMDLRYPLYEDAHLGT